MIFFIFFFLGGGYWAEIRIFFVMTIRYSSDLTHDIMSGDFQEKELSDGLRNKQRIINIQLLVVA